jgi:hypothetical protein
MQEIKSHAQIGTGGVHAHAKLMLIFSLVVPQTEMSVVALSSPNSLDATQVTDIVTSSLLKISVILNSPIEPRMSEISKMPSSNDNMYICGVCSSIPVELNCTVSLGTGLEDTILKMNKNVTEGSGFGNEHSKVTLGNTESTLSRQKECPTV